MHASHIGTLGTARLARFCHGDFPVLLFGVASHKFLRRLRKITQVIRLISSCPIIQLLRDKGNFVSRHSDGQVRFWTLVRTWTSQNRTWSSVQGSQKWLNRTSGPVQGSTTEAMVQTSSNHKCLEDEKIAKYQQILKFWQCDQSRVCYCSFRKII